LRGRTVGERRAEGDSRVSVHTEQLATGAGVHVEHRPRQRRFVLLDAEDDELAHTEYVERDGLWVFTHTYTEPHARHSGRAGQVVNGALDGARAMGMRIRAVCPFVADYLQQHPDYRDLVGPSSRALR
jgi:predicted GNAT family acetyltransferase